MKMCGRYLFLTDNDYDKIQGIVDEISPKYGEANLANGEVFPTNTVPVIYSHNGKTILSSAKWGFPNFKNNGVIINARSETIAQKPMFSKAFASKRCLVPANGYFEWLTEDKKKTKYLIRLKDKPLFFMAGIYNLFNDKNGTPYAGIAIITTEANPDINFLHDRMPVIIPDVAINTWLDSGITDLTTLQNLLTPYGTGMIDYKVTE